MWSAGDAVAAAVAEGPVTAPGTEQHYANINYLVLGNVIEVATGESYEEVLQRRILDPLGLTGTGLESALTSLPVPHEVPAPGGPPLPLGEFDTTQLVASSWTAGGLVSTVDDLLAFMDALVAGRVLNAEQLTLMFDTTTPSRSGYGLGMSAYDFDGRTIFGHNGRTVGFAAAIRHDPATGVTVAVLSNDGSAVSSELAEQLLRPQT